MTDVIKDFEKTFKDKLPMDRLHGYPKEAGYYLAAKTEWALRGYQAALLTNELQVDINQPAAIKAAKSVGKHFGAEIRGKFSHKLITAKPK